MEVVEVKRREEGKYEYMEGEGVLMGIMQNGLQRGLISLCYRTSKGPSANNQGLATLTTADHTVLYVVVVGQVGSCFSPSQYVSNLIWVAGLIKGDINHCPGHLRIKSTLGELVNPECGPFSFKECLEVMLGDKIILPNYRG